SKAGSLHQPHKLGNGSNAQFLHHTTAVDFHCLLRRAQLSRDLLVQQACDHEPHHFKLAWRQKIKETPSLILLSTAPSLLRGPDQSALYTLQQLVISKRLPKKIDRARFHCLRAHWDVAMAGNKYELFLAAVLDQSVLEIHPVDTWHLYIHDHARRAAV